MDTDQVVRAILQIKRLAPDERKQMGQNGIDAVLKHFTYRHLAEKFIAAIPEEAKR